MMNYDELCLIRRTEKNEDILALLYATVFSSFNLAAPIVCVCVCVCARLMQGALPPCPCVWIAPISIALHIDAGLLVGHGFEVLSKDQELKQHDGVSICFYALLRLMGYCSKRSWMASRPECVGFEVLNANILLVFPCFPPAFPYFPYFHGS